MWIKSWFDLPIMDNYHVEIIVWVLWAYHHLNKAVKSIFEKSDENLKTVYLERRKQERPVKSCPLRMSWLLQVWTSSSCGHLLSIKPFNNSNLKGGGAPEGPHLLQQLLKADVCWKGDGHFSLGVQSLKGCLCPSGSPHACVHIGSTNCI